MLEDILAGRDKHPLFKLSKECLDDDPSSRPPAETLVTRLQEVKAVIECPYGIAVARVDAVKEVLMVRALGEGYAERGVEPMLKVEETQQLRMQQKHEKIRVSFNNCHVREHSISLSSNDPYAPFNIVLATILLRVTNCLHQPLKISLPLPPFTVNNRLSDALSKYL